MYSARMKYMGLSLRKFITLLNHLFASKRETFLVYLSVASRYLLFESVVYILRKQTFLTKGLMCMFIGYA